MADYKAMYLAAMDAMERAIETLTAAQQRCEDLYVATSGEEAPLWPQAARPAKEADDAEIKKEGERGAFSLFFYDVLRLTQTGHPSCAAALSA